MKKTIFLLFTHLLASACTTGDEPPGTPASANTVGAVTVSETPALTTEPAATAVTPTDLPAPTELSPPTAVPVEPTVESPAATESTQAAQQTGGPVASTSTEIVAGRTTDGAYFLGAPDAPVTFLDYSDFL